MNPGQFSSASRTDGKIFTNPILPGGYPDPSICRVGDDYYLVNSSFEYFPGLPIHHSKDLVNWELIGYGLHRVEQCTGPVNLMDVQTRGGIHAPTIRFHAGTFYIITTNVYQPQDKNQPTACVNFIITAENVAGLWSDPHVLAGAPGIDPDIFFDEDGRVWYIGTHSPENPSFEGEGEIWLQELDLGHWELKGERYFLWRGACGGVWAEGPHIYKRNGWYYLMIAEGGTSFNHAVMIAVSEKITGPYLSNPRNPIFTSRHLSYDHWVHSTGHADLVELPDGRWFMVALGIRGDEDRGSNMGRETHLIPVIWEREPFEWQPSKSEWPVCAPISGRVERINPVPFGGSVQAAHAVFHDDFIHPTFNLEWNFRRVPMLGTYSLQARASHLRLFAKSEVIEERGRYSFLGIRQTQSDFEFTVKMSLPAQANETEAGVLLLQQDDNYLKYTLSGAGDQTVLKLVLATATTSPEIIAQHALPDYAGEIIFKVISKAHRYFYEYSLDDGNTFLSFAGTGANLILSRGYTGAYLGFYASNQGMSTEVYADFDWVRYQGFERG